MAKLRSFDKHLEHSAYVELQGRMHTIATDIERRQEERDNALQKAAEEDAAIKELLRIHDEYQTVVGRAFPVKPVEEATLDTHTDPRETARLVERSFLLTATPAL